MKKILATLLLGAILAVTALPVLAADADNAVTLTASGNTAAVHLTLPKEEAQGITAMQLSFTVESKDAVKAEFVFADSVSASVKEYTYNEQTGILNVYLAGRNELLDSDGAADLGKIQLNGADGSQASVSFVQDSLRLVDASLGQPEATVTSNGEVNLTVAEPDTPVTTPTVTPKPEQNTPQGNSQGSNSQSSSNDSGSVSGPASGSASDSDSTSASTPVPIQAPAVGGAVGGQTGSSQHKGQSSVKSTATPAPEATAAPDEDAQSQATAAPVDETPSPAETASPEQALSDQDGGSKLPVVPIAIAVCVVVAAIIGLAVVRFAHS